MADSIAAVFFASDRRVGKGLATYAQLDQSVLGDQETINAVASDADAMDAVSTSSTAMDAVSVSDLALDAIWDSQDVGWPAVRDVNMAVGKFAVGRAGLDGANYADMDAVAASTTAMDAVSASTLALDSVFSSALAAGAYFESSHIVDVVWTSDAYSESVWEQGISTTLPTTVIDDDGDGTPEFDLRFTSGPQTNGRAIEYEWVNTSNGDGTRHFFEYTVDISDYSNLVIQTEKANGSYNPVVIQIDNTEIFTTSNRHSWTKRTLDVSTYSGNVTIKIGIKNTVGGQATEYLRHAEPRLT